MATALVKRNHRRAVELTGDTLGPEEEAIDRDYRAAARVPSPDEEGWRRALLHDPDRLTLARGRFLASVGRELAPLLGPGEPFSTKDEWRYDTPIGPWTLVTFVDVGGTLHQLAYTQTIRAGGPRPLREGLSICGWLGLGGGHTVWDRLTEGDTPAAAQSLARVCAHLLRALPDLLAGLVP